MPFSSGSSHDIPSVSELTGFIKDLLESNFDGISVHGEVSQPTVSTNGHLYFTLKDEKAQLSCVMWRGNRQSGNVQLVHGQQISAFGTIQVYAPHGRYQLVVSQIQQAGTGALQAAFDKLKKQLQSEGLFDKERKRSLPFFPKSIGVITSETSAAWQDISVNIQKRWPNVMVYLYHASTQGANAAPELVRGLHFFAQKLPVDVIIIGRGGGSIEDLWPFNEEAVARAIAASPYPVISGVGHETDFTISDFVADIRANTPTQAAILATPNRLDLMQKVDDTTRLLHQLMQNKWAHRSQIVKQISGSYTLNKLIHRILAKVQEVKLIREQIKNKIEKRFRENEVLIQRSTYENIKLVLLNRVSQKNQNLLQIKTQISTITSQHLLVQERRFLSLQSKLKSLNPMMPLEKGFTQVLQNDKMVKAMSDFKLDKPFKIKWKDGSTELNPK